MIIIVVYTRFLGLLYVTLIIIIILFTCVF